MNHLVDGDTSTSPPVASTRTTVIHRFLGSHRDSGIIPFQIGERQSHSTPLAAVGSQVSQDCLAGQVAGWGGLQSSVSELGHHSLRESAGCGLPTQGRGINVMSNHNTSTGGIVTSAGDGACIVAMPGNLPGMSENVRVLAIRDTSAYIKQVVANFNAKVGTFPVEAQQDIKDLNAYIQSVSLQDPAVAVPSSLPRGGGYLGMGTSNWGRGKGR